MEPVPAYAVDAHLRDFRELCRRKGFALTHQRLVLYREILLLGGHPSPEALYERVRAQIPSISLGTVYKNIRTFIDTGLLREVSLHHGSQRLEANGDPHHHLVCSRCRRIFDVPQKDVAPVRFRGTPPRGFRIQSISVELHGLCAACAKGQGRKDAAQAPSLRTT